MNRSDLSSPQCLPELKLVVYKDATHLLSYFNYHFGPGLRTGDIITDHSLREMAEGENPDVDPEEMKKSDSKFKFVYSLC